MRYRGLASALVAVLALSLMVGCKSSTEPDNGDQAPAWEVDSISIPDNMAQSQDPNAQIAVAFVNMANAITGFSQMFTPPPQATLSPSILGVQDGPWEYTWTENGLTITLTITQTETEITWEIVYDGTDGVYVYDDWTFIEAEVLTDGSEGWMRVYEPVTAMIDIEWSWTVDDQTDFFEFVMIWYDMGVADGKIEIDSYADGSGHMYVYEYILAWILDWECEWAADGSGSWWDWDNGVIVSEGSWGP